MTREEAHAMLTAIRATLDTAASQIADLHTAATSVVDGHTTPPAVRSAALAVVDAAAGLDDVIQVCHDAESATYREGL